jgi:hypothetical protein
MHAAARRRLRPDYNLVPHILPCKTYRGLPGLEFAHVRRRHCGSSSALARASRRAPGRFGAMVGDRGGGVLVLFVGNPIIVED